jgi:hypothetical protein
MSIEKYNRIEKSDDLYDAKKYAQVLEPKSDLENKIWRQIDRADFPIINILKRLNRLSLDGFPEDEFITADSCSGHVMDNGKIEEDPHVIFVIRPKFEITEEDGEEYAEVEDFNEKHCEEFIGFFRKIFINSVNKVNAKYNQEVMRFGFLDYREKEDGQFIDREYINKEPVQAYDPKGEESFYVYNVGYFFKIDSPENGQILKYFWADVEDELSKIDKIKYKTDFEKISFSK